MFGLNFTCNDLEHICDKFKMHFKSSKFTLNIWAINTATHHFINYPARPIYREAATVGYSEISSRPSKLSVCRVYKWIHRIQVFLLPHQKARVIYQTRDRGYELLRYVVHVVIGRVIASIRVY